MIILSQIARVFGAASRYFDRINAARSLHAMSDRQLRDIGIDRDQIDHLVFEGRQSPAKRPAAARPVYKRPAFSLAATQ